MLSPTFKTLIVDDERLGRENLHTLLRHNFPYFEEVYMASDVEDAISKIDQVQPDLLFLDVQLMTGTGFDVLNGVRYRNMSVIFMTAFSQYAIRAIKFSALDYLLKPIDTGELVRAVQRFLSLRVPGDENEKIQSLITNVKDSSALPTRISLPTSNGLAFYDIKDIMRCEADNNYTIFHFRTGKSELVSRTLKEYEELLEGYRFCRVHKSHLVNLSYVTRYINGEGGILVMPDNKEIPVSRRMKPALMELLSRV